MKGELMFGDAGWSFTQFFQDMVCWFKCLFHDCSCYHHDDWSGNDDSDAKFKRERIAREERERLLREKEERERAKIEAAKPKPKPKEVPKKPEPVDPGPPPMPPAVKERGPYWEAPRRMLPYEPSAEPEDNGEGMTNATLFRRMGPELNPKRGGVLDTTVYEPKSWSNSANGQNKQEVNGLPSNKDAPEGQAWAPKHPYLPDSEAIANTDKTKNLPYQNEEGDYDDIAF